MSKMIKGLNKNDILDKGLEMCGQYMGSYSDACKLSLLENFEDLYEYVSVHIIILIAITENLFKEYSIQTHI